MASHIEPQILRSRPQNKGSRCCVPQCNNRWGVDKSMNIFRSYYRFPADKKLKKQWEARVRREGWVASPHDRICSDHFVGGKRTLMPGSRGYIPSIFAFQRSGPSRTTSTSIKAGADCPLDGPPVPTPTVPGTSKRSMDYAIRQQTKKTKIGKENHRKIWETGHDYIETQKVKETSEHDEELIALHKRIAQLEAENESRQLQFSLENLQTDNQQFQLYTNLPNIQVFDALCDFLHKQCDGDLTYWRGSKDTCREHDLKPGKAKNDRQFTFREELFMVLVQLKTGDFTTEIARKFNTSAATVSKIFTTWANFLHNELRSLFEMKNSWEDIEIIPECFHRYPNLLSVIDCTEFQVEKAATLQARKETYSNYKNRDTVKFMVGLSPALTVNFVSRAYGGRASDKHITLSSDQFLDSLPQGSSIMADKGFNLSKELQNQGVHLIIPDFKNRGRSQMTPEEVKRSETIASARIHVERIIQRIRTFHILDSVIPLSQQDITEQIITICSYLVNFQLPIINLRQGHDLPSVPSQSIFDIL